MSAGYILSLHGVVTGNAFNPGELGIQNSGYYTVLKSQNLSTNISYTFPPTLGVQNDVLTLGPTNTELSWSSNISLSSSGSGLVLPVDSYGPELTIKSLTAGVNIALTSTPEEIIITNSSPSYEKTLTSLGGTSVIYNPTGPDYQLKSLRAGYGIELLSSPTDITITNILPSDMLTLSSSGTGLSLVNVGVGPDFVVKGYSADGSGISALDKGLYLNFECNPASASAVLTYFGSEYTWPADTGLWVDLPYNLMETNFPNENVSFDLANEYLSDGIDVTINSGSALFLVEATIPYNVGFIMNAASGRIATGNAACVTGNEVVTHTWGQPPNLGVPNFYTTSDALTLALEGRGLNVFFDQYVTWPTNAYVSYTYAEIPVTYFFSEQQVYLSAVIRLNQGTTRVRAQRICAGSNPYSAIPVISTYEDWFQGDQQAVASTNLLADKPAKLCIVSALRLRQL